MKQVTVGMLAFVMAALMSLAQGAPEGARFVLESHGLPVTGIKDGKPYLETAQVLIKLDTATGRAWRYACEKVMGDGPTPETKSEVFVAVPVDALGEEKAETAGRFRILEASLRAAVTSGGILKSYQGQMAVLLLDEVTGRVWSYRGERQDNGGKSQLKEGFVLLKESALQP